MSTTLTEPRTLTIKQRLQSPELVNELAKAMPSHCKPERMARIAITALTRTPKLMECEQASFFRCLLDLSQWGLEPDGRRAHLIPFNNTRRGVVECQLIIDYKGYVELAYRSGVVRNIHADVVRDGDIFEYSTGRVLRHVPHFLRRDADKPADAGKVFAIYCIVELVGDTVKTEVLSQAEVDAIRKRSKSGNNGPWVTDWCEMAKKTAFRRATKWIPLSAELRDALDRDDDKIVDAVGVIEHTPHASTVDDLSAVLGGGGDSDDDVHQGEAADDVPAKDEFLDAAFMDQARQAFDEATAELAVVRVRDAFKAKCQTDDERTKIDLLADVATKRIKKK
jgi:recombination protein RecT